MSANEKAKEAAIEDIKNELQKQAKCFLAFIEILNPVMEKLVNQQIKRQDKISKHKKSLS